MIVRGGERVLVQGITGRQGTFWTERMQAYGTRIVAGVNPRRAGVEHRGVPVFASAADAMREVGFDVSVLFIPPLGVRAAAIDAIEAGCPRLVVLTEHVPVQDVMEVLAAARANGAAVAGPNTAGLVTPGECFVGFMPAFEPNIFRPGRVGVVSRSGSLGTLVCLNLVQAGFGESAFIGIGAYTMMRADSYRAIGGHECVALRPDEDLRLGQIVKRSGMRSGFLKGVELLEIRWYHSFGGFVRGLDKNFFAALDYSVFVVTGSTATLAWLAAGPLVMAPLLLATGQPLAGALYAACPVICWAAATTVSRDNSYPWRFVLPFPLAVLVIVFTIWRSTLLTIFRGVSWGGPPVPLKELKKARIRR